MRSDNLRLVCELSQLFYGVCRGLRSRAAVDLEVLPSGFSEILIELDLGAGVDEFNETFLNENFYSALASTRGRVLVPLLLLATTTATTTI